MKRTWITVKRGILEPKHRFALGELIWLFMYILDITNWEAGTIENWLDRGAAEELEMPLATLRDQRRKLQEKGYITCEPKQHGIRVIVHNWTNPKEYTGQKYNSKSTSDTPSDTPSLESVASNDASSYSQKSQNKNQKETEVPIPDSLNTEEFIKAWSEWIAFRKEIKKKMTPTIQEKQLKKLSEYSPGVAAAMLEQSMVNGWTGLFPIKNNDVGAKYGI